MRIMDCANDPTPKIKTRNFFTKQLENSTLQRIGASENSSTKRNAVQVELNGVMGKNLATTYSRGAYRTTTIGNAVFDGRVRDGIGSGHNFMVTKKPVVSDE